MYVCNTVKMQVKKIRIKKLSCLSFHTSCSQNFFYLYFFFLFSVFFFFFHFGFALLVWLSNFLDNLDLVLYTTTTVSNWRFFLH